MLKVILLNKEDFKTLSPLEIVGQTASVCYNTKTDKEGLKRIGLTVLRSHHGSPQRGVIFRFKVEGWNLPLKTQLFRYQVGSYYNEISRRRVKVKESDYYIPDSLKELYTPDEIEIFKNIWDICYETYNLLYKIKTQSLDKNNQEDKKLIERYKETLRFLLPQMQSTDFVWMVSLEELIHIFNERRCIEAQPEWQEFLDLIEKEVLEIEPDLKEFLVAGCYKCAHPCKYYKKRWWENKNTDLTIKS